MVVLRLGINVLLGLKDFIDVGGGHFFLIRPTVILKLNLPLVLSALDSVF
jgi:hypothetical protein